MTLPMLTAAGPHPAHADQLMLYGRFVGTWKVDGRNLDERGEWAASHGEWHFAWGLQGLAVIDCIHSPPRADLAAGSPLFDIGTTIRVYDPGTDTWQITFVTAVGRRVERLTAREVAGDIHQDGMSSDGLPIRWNFTDITSDSATWRGYASHDGGMTWRLNEEMLLRRLSTG